MKKKLTITYIKNNEEKTIKNGFQYEFKAKEIFYNIIQGYDYEDYTIKKEIKLLHIKNANFKGRVEFNCHNSDTMVILENCNFDYCKIKLRDGIFQIINSTFKENSHNTIDVGFCQDFEIKGDKNTIIQGVSIEDTKKVNINSIDKIDNLKLLYCNKVKIKDVNSINKFFCNCQMNLNIENSKINDKTLGATITLPELTLKNSRIAVENISLCCEKVVLENNSSITSNESTEIKSHIKEILIDDTSHIKGSSIKIGDHEYKNENNTPFILNKNMLSNMWFVRKNLICALKELKRTYESKINKNLKVQEQQEIDILDKEESNQIKKIKESINNQKEKVKKRINCQERPTLLQTKIKDI